MPQVSKGDSIASEGKGDYMYVEGRVLDTQGNPIPGAVIDTWEADGNGLYDTEVLSFRCYALRSSYARPNKVCHPGRTRLPWSVDLCGGWVLRLQGSSVGLSSKSLQPYKSDIHLFPPAQSSIRFHVMVQWEPC